MWKVSTSVAAKRGRTRGSTPLERSSWDSAINSSRSGLLGPGLPLAPHALTGLLPDTQPRVDLPTTSQPLEVLFHAYRFKVLTIISLPIFVSCSMFHAELI